MRTTIRMNTERRLTMLNEIILRVSDLVAALSNGCGHVNLGAFFFKA